MFEHHFNKQQFIVHCKLPTDSLGSPQVKHRAIQIAINTVCAMLLPLAYCEPASMNSAVDAHTV